MKKTKKPKTRKNITPFYIRDEIIKGIADGMLTPTTAAERYGISRPTIYKMLEASNTEYVRYRSHIGNKFALAKKTKKVI